jgi:Arc/MetJ-type ribon-helix-helix transcriptional regulator
MESLVVEEVEKQVQQLPNKVRPYVNQSDVIAYALNRLPALYATSEKGWQQQRARAAKEMGSRIVTAVRQAIAAVQRDPLRTVAPLKIEQEQDPLSALQGLRDLLRIEELSWKNVVDVVEYTLMKTSRGEITWRKRGAAPAQKYDWQKYHI